MAKILHCFLVVEFQVPFNELSESKKAAIVDPLDMCFTKTMPNGDIQVFASVNCLGVHFPKQDSLKVVSVSQVLMDLIRAIPRLDSQFRGALAPSDFKFPVNFYVGVPKESIKLKEGVKDNSKLWRNSADLPFSVLKSTFDSYHSCLIRVIPRTIVHLTSLVDFSFFSLLESRYEAQFLPILAVEFTIESQVSPHFSFDFDHSCFLDIPQPQKRAQWTSLKEIGSKITALSSRHALNCHKTFLRVESETDVITHLNADSSLFAINWPSSKIREFSLICSRPSSFKQSSLSLSFLECKKTTPLALGAILPQFIVSPKSASSQDLSTLTFVLGIESLLSFVFPLEYSTSPSALLSQNSKEEKLLKGLKEYYEKVAFIQVGRLAWGSGFLFIGKWVITCRHVVKYGTLENLSVFFPFDKQAYSVKKILMSEEGTADIAVLVLKNERETQENEPIRLGEKPKTGQKVYAVGYPVLSREFVKGPAVLSGKISKVSGGEEQTLKEKRKGQVIITDAMIYQGNSGGVLLQKSPKGPLLVGLVWANLSIGTSITQTFNFSYCINDETPLGRIIKAVQDNQEDEETKSKWISKELGKKDKNLAELMEFQSGKTAPSFIPWKVESPTPKL